MGKTITLEELAAMYLTGGRNSGEKSRVVESRYYSRDPLDNYEYPSERARKEEVRRQQKAKRKGRK